MNSFFLLFVSSVTSLLSFVGVLVLFFTLFSTLFFLMFWKKMKDSGSARPAIRVAGYVTFWCLVVAACLKYLFLV